MKKLTRRGFLAWAMAIAISLHIPTEWLSAEENPPAPNFVPEDCFMAFPMCFPLHFLAPPPNKKHYLTYIGRQT